MSERKPHEPIGLPTFCGIQVIPSPMLPDNTMVVSLDVYRMLRKGQEAEAPTSTSEPGKPS